MAKQHIWANTGNAFPDDQLLREANFRIEHRHAGGQPIWSRDGKLYFEQEALNLVAHEARLAAAGKPD